MKRRLSSVKERRDMRFGDQHHDGSILYVSNLSPTLGGLGNVSLVDGEGYREVSGVKRFDVQEVVSRPRHLLMRFTRISAAADASLDLPVAS